MTVSDNHGIRRGGLRAAIAGVGSCLPERVITNRELEQTLDTNDEWIRSRTGIGERRVVDDETATSDLALVAAKRAMAQAGVTAADLDLIIVATVTPDMMFPSTASIVQHHLGARQAAAFDLEAACSGFVYALATGTQFIESGAYKTVLVIGADTLSKITDWTDRGTAILLGDGAGAVVLRPVPAETGGILSFHLAADGAGGDLLLQPAGGSRMPATVETVTNRMHCLQMNGREVYKFAVKAMGDASLAAVEKAGLTFDDIDFYVPHQANYRIIEASARRFDLPMERVVTNVQRLGNTSAGSVGIALDEITRGGLVGPGDNVLMVAFGGGLTWGAVVVRWILPRNEHPEGPMADEPAL